MQGKKLVQTQTAMKTILSEMIDTDLLTIINFADNVHVWNEYGEVLKASPENIDLAIDFIENLEAKGGTNINDALLEGIRIVKVRFSLKWSRPEFCPKGPLIEYTLNVIHLLFTHILINFIKPCLPL